MTSNSVYRSRIALVGAVLAPLTLAVVLVPFRKTFASTAAALLLVAVVEAVAVVGNRLLGLTASISAALWFDFFLTTPYEL
jgi:K+-sensing histidine kinase KdpD